MRIVDIRECAVPLKSDIRNSSFDFSEMTTSVVAVITDVVRPAARRYARASSLASSPLIRAASSTRHKRTSIPHKFSPS